MPADRRAELRRMIVRRLNTDEWMERHFAISCHAGDVADAVMEVLPESWPMPAEPGYTPDPADVELMARTAYEADAEVVGPLSWPWPKVPIEIREQYQTKAHRQLSALAADGRLAGRRPTPHLDAVKAERDKLVETIGRLVSLPPAAVADAYGVTYTGEVQP